MDNLKNTIVDILHSRLFCSEFGYSLPVVDSIIISLLEIDFIIDNFSKFITDEDLNIIISKLQDNNVDTNNISKTISSSSIAINDNKFWIRLLESNTERIMESNEFKIINN